MFSIAQQRALKHASKIHGTALASKRLLSGKTNSPTDTHPKTTPKTLRAEKLSFLKKVAEL